MVQTLLYHVLKNDTTSTYCVESAFYLFITFVLCKNETSLDIKSLITENNSTPSFYILLIMFEYITASLANSEIKQRRGFEWLPKLPSAQVFNLLKSIIISNHYVRFYLGLHFSYTWSCSERWMISMDISNNMWNCCSMY